MQSVRIDEETLESLVGRVLVEMLLLERVRALLSFFGGRLLTESLTQFVLRPREALRLGALGVGAIMAWTTWPHSDVWMPTDLWDALARSGPDWDALRVALPVIVLAIGVAVVLPRAPLLDRIRARDEAAKDANRMLAKWSYGAFQLGDAARARAYEVHRNAAALVDRRLQSLHPALSYSSDGLVDDRQHDVPVLAPFRPGSGRALSLEDGALVRALQNLQARSDEIREAGLADVARALVPSVWPFIVRAEVDWSMGEALVTERSFLTDAALEKRLVSRVTLTLVNEYERGRGTGSPTHVLAYERLEHAARDTHHRLEVWAVDLALQAGCLAAAHGLLSRRLLGSPWTRLLSAAKA